VFLSQCKTMETTITTCQGCGCNIVNERVTKGRLRKWCSDSCRQRWRYRNCQPKVNTYTKQKERGYLNKWKALQCKGGKCQRCGENRPAALCFHHRDPGQKKIKLDGRTFANIKWESIEEEISKCDLLCHNCHNIVHFGDSWEDFLKTLNQTS
jgi:hypothetical protein